MECDAFFPSLSCAKLTNARTEGLALWYWHSFPLQAWTSSSELSVGMHYEHVQIFG